MNSPLSEKSVYRVLAQYIEKGKKFDNYIKGYIDGEDKLNLFLADYYHYSGTRFTIRSSCKKNKDACSPGSSKIPQTRTRYGREDRVYWEFNNRNLVVPFTGVPFITRSSQVKHCQHGSQYYKLKAQKTGVKSPNEILDQPVMINNPSGHHSELVKKQRRPKPSKKRNCPAYMYIREIVMFPQYSLTTDECAGSKHIVRKQKTNLIYRLRKEMGSGGLETLQRFYVHVPLPEAHADHPIEAGSQRLRVMDPMVQSKIDELLAAGIYKGRYIQLIIQDYIIEGLLKNSNMGYPSTQPNYPTEEEINDYVYLTSVTSTDKSAQMVPSQMVERREIRGEMQRSVQELVLLLKSCSDKDTLHKAKSEMVKVIQRVRKSSAPNPACYSLPPHNPRTRLCETGKQATDIHPNTEGNHFTTHMPSQEPLQTPLHHPEIMMHQSNNEDLLNGILMPGSLGDIHQGDMMPTFSRLLESEHGMMPSLDERIMGQGSEFAASISGPQIIHELRPMHQPSYMK